MATVSIGRQVATLAGEQLHIDRRVREAAARGVMRRVEADYIIEGIEAALRTLEWVRDNEATIRRVHEALKAGEETTP